MPRRAPPAIAVAPVNTLLPPPLPSPIIQSLRKDWRWAAISQFVYTFSDAFGLLDWEIEALENDFDGDETVLVPTLIAKLLFALTYNRQINRDNAFEHLRKQYLKRLPDNNPFGTLDEPIEWATLGLGKKVEALHQLCEWQMEDPARFRGLLKSEDDAVSWRIDPIGWDKPGNTYWLFDDNRIWIQRPLPLPLTQAKKSSLKAKRALKRARAQPPVKKSKTKPIPKKKAPPARKPKPKTPGEKKTKKERTPTPPPVELTGSRRRTAVAFYGNPTPTALALKRGSGGPAATPTRAGGRATRSSGRFSAVGLDEEEEKPATRATRSRAAAPAKAAPRAGVRSSRRHRAPTEEEEDDQEPLPEKPSRSTRATRSNKVVVEDQAADEDSELSELTDEDEPLEPSSAAAVAEEVEPEPTDVDSPLSSIPPDLDMELPKEDEEEDYEPDDASSDEGENGEDEAQEEDAEEEDDGDDEEEEDIVKAAVREANAVPEGFVEWEAICITLYDYRTFPLQFASSKHPDEKALYSLLQKSICPPIIELLTAQEVEKQKAAKFIARKRSSRIAEKESEREEIERRQKAEREMVERMERTRREEERAKREANAAEYAERSREERLREREERAQAREEAALKKAEEELNAKEKAEKSREERKRRREAGEEGSETPEVENQPQPQETQQYGRGHRRRADRWEVACEVCRTHGWNIDGDRDMVSCDQCGRWQHVECHDRLDRSVGKVRRNWDQVDFKCQDCTHRAAKRPRIDTHSNGHSHSHSHPSQPSSHHSQPSAQPLSPYPILPGSAPGPPPPIDPAHPPPPPLQPGQFYLPYQGYQGHAGKEEKPAGYAVYYPPGHPNAGERRISGGMDGRRVSDGYGSPGQQPPEGYRRTSQGYAPHQQSPLAQPDYLPSHGHPHAYPPGHSQPHSHQPPSHHYPPPGQGYAPQGQSPQAPAPRLTLPPLHQQLPGQNLPSSRFPAALSAHPLLHPQHHGAPHPQQHPGQVYPGEGYPPHGAYGHGPGHNGHAAAYAQGQPRDLRLQQSPPQASVHAQRPYP
ncbi:hypothetical protein I350_00888 [Cryptococcus amylolentus CBS 6273]|uniref:PHD-type domain-containing protein n=1 Tax=Cryptococcus amylolentus CBS 6273 TaxID=1296118 RepID=A0A1E3KIE9_9TREE|nr:hypothetical protein I350_00888 [Cryptococcus amylolentus CBS 6273]